MTILAYHAIHPDWDSSLAVHPAAFARQAAWLVRHRSVISLDEAVQRLRRTGRLPPGLAVITFDDGFECLHRHALPILERHRLPATVFLVAETLTPQGRVVDWVDNPPAEPPGTLSLEQVMEMKEAGVTFGSHSWSHRDLTKLSEGECEQDLRRSRELLQDLLGVPVPFLAYPRGMQDERVRRAAARAGYTHGFVEEISGSEARGSFAIGRTGIYPANGLTAFRAKTSRWYLPFRTSPAFPAIRRVMRGPNTSRVPSG